MERWLPALSLAIGISLMAAAAVAQGQPAPAQPVPQAAPPMAGSGAGADGPPRPRGAWSRHFHRDGFRPVQRDQMCKDGYAREAGFLAYLGAKLELTAAQQPLWDKYQQAMLDAAATRRQVCLDNAKSPIWELTVLERRDRVEKLLTTRLDALHATRPPLEALYQALSPEQRATLDHRHRHGPMR